jgi:predicted TIM-barrel fold metal-dependent hydrolase
MLDVDALLRPYFDRLVDEVGGLDLYDAHTHVGANDPDGFSQTPEQLLKALGGAGARGVVFPMHEPGGYREANDFVIGAAEASGGTVVPYCRVDPRDGAVAEATRALDAGARGIKLHPRAERFGLDEPAVRGLVELAHERRVPVLIHAGRGIPALGEHTVALSGEFPDAKLILAHGAISDLAWLWQVMPDHPNLFVDTAWWNPADLMALFCLAPPAQVLWASDSPYGLPVMSAVVALRCALQAGLEPAAVRSIAGGQMARLLEGEPGADAGPPPRVVRPLDPHLERVVTHLVGAMGRAFARADPEEPIALARLACAVGSDQECSPVCAAVLDLLDIYEEHKHEPPTDGRPFPPAGRFVVTALAVARTPDVALPALPDAPAPTRAEAERAPEA